MTWDPNSVVRGLSLFDAVTPGGSTETAVAVSTLAQSVRHLIERSVQPLWVRGEIIDFKAHRNGHWYFSLRDRAAQLRCVVWADDQRRIRTAIEDGMAVVVYGQVTV